MASPAMVKGTENPGYVGIVLMDLSQADGYILYDLLIAK